MLLFYATDKNLIMEDDFLIEACIRAVRARIKYGMSENQIYSTLKEHFPQDILFFSFHAAKILEDAEKNKK